MALSAHITALRAIDSHTGGEPTRLIVEGFPDLGEGSMAERRARFAQHYDDWRCAVMLEPRGNDVLVGALLCRPCSPQATAGVIFFNNSGYLGMCGHGTIGLIASLAHRAHPRRASPDRDPGRPGKRHAARGRQRHGGERGGLSLPPPGTA